jgi:hypothetical protein
VLLTRSTTRSRSLDAAQSYALGLGWSVVPGCDQGRRGRRCGRGDCLSAAPHPASEHAHLAATRDENTIRRWWRHGPHAPVLLPTGQNFDVLDVPAAAADEAMVRVKLTGYRMGPVATTIGGRLLIWVRTGARLITEITDRRPWPYTALGLHCRSAGEYVLAPPSVGTSWLIPPVEFGQPTLPHCADILPAVAQACSAVLAPSVGIQQRH